MARTRILIRYAGSVFLAITVPAIVHAQRRVDTGQPPNTSSSADFERRRTAVDSDPRKWLSDTLPVAFTKEGISKAQDSKDPEFLYLYGRALMLVGNYREAMQAFDLALNNLRAERKIKLSLDVEIRVAEASAALKQANRTGATLQEALAAKQKAARVLEDLITLHGDVQPSPSPITRNNQFIDAFSVQRWGTGRSQLGDTWYQNEEYHMRATRGGYLVMYSPNTKDYYDENATVRVGLRSVDGVSPNSGYGLIVHGEKKNGLLEDYAFLIYNGDNPKYKIVQHKGGTETTLVNWTRSSAIRSGTSPNQLEVRVKDRTMEFYINGQYLTSINDVASFLRGRVGFYSSDTGEVAFDDLEIIR